MVPKKKPRTRREIAQPLRIPLRAQAEEALNGYFDTLNGHKPARLYALVMREIEEPLFKVVMNHVEGNQSRAATILGINRGTLRKKLKEFGLEQA